MANGIACDGHGPGRLGADNCGQRADSHVGMRPHPQRWGPKSLVSQDVGAMLVFDGVSTETSNGTHSVFPRARAASAPAVRSPACVLCRGDAVRRCGPLLRL